MKQVYLAGPIYGCTDAEAKGWREEATRALLGRYGVLDPMSRDYRGVPNLDVKKLVEDDLRDIESAYFILVNANRATWGTAMELWHAHRKGKRIVAFGNVPFSPWLVYVTEYRCYDVQEAVAYLLAEQ